MKIALVVLTLVSLTLAVAAGGLWKELRLQREANQKLETSARPVCPVKQPARDASSSPEPTPCISAQASLQAETPVPSSSHSDQLYEQPEFRAAMADYQHIALRQQYAAIMAALHLSPDKSDQLSRLLADQAVRGMHGIPKDFTTEEWRKRNDDELRKVLSPSELASFRHYQDTAATRDQVGQLRNELMVTNEPLRDDQVEPLIEAIFPEEMRLSEDANAFRATLDTSPEAIGRSERTMESYFREREAAATQRKLTAASAILSSRQLKALERQLEAQAALGTAGTRVRHLHDEIARAMNSAAADEAQSAR